MSHNCFNEDCCNNHGCNNNRCNKILEKYHCMINKSNDLYNEAVEEQTEAIQSVIEAIESLEKFKCLFNESYEIYDAANELLKESNCCFDCSANSCKCKRLDKKSDELYYAQFREICEAIELLKKALCELREAENYGTEADEVFEKYTSCVHNKCEF